MIVLAEPTRRSLDRVLAASVAARKRDSLDPLEPRLERLMATAFRKQARAFLTGFKRFEPWFPGPRHVFIAADDIDALFDEAALHTVQVFRHPLDEFTARALASGMRAAVAEIGIGPSFTLEHPEAVTFLETNGAERVTQLNETTRTALRKIVTQAADEGWGYDKTARAIRKRYKDFSVTRAKNIAVYEVGNAYEHGNMLVAKELQDAGLVMQKHWLTVGDDRVRPAHRANQAEGWIPLDDAFQNGSDRPPTDPKCRCTLQMRREPTP